MVFKEIVSDSSSPYIYMPIAINLVLLQRAIKLGCQLDQSGPVTIVDIYIYIYQRQIIKAKMVLEIPLEN